MSGREVGVELLLLTAGHDPEAVLPGLALLGHRVRTASLEATALLDAPAHEAILVDACSDPAAARAVCRLLDTAGRSAPVVGVFTEGGLVTVTAEWALDDIVLHTAGPAELDARLRLLTTRRAAEDPEDEAVTLGDLSIEEATYTARLRGRALELTYKEFELLKYLAQRPGRVFTRVQLLAEVWGYDFFGGARTVDVHVRRLRAKLGPEHESMIVTVRNVGYKLVQPPGGTAPGRDSENGVTGS